MPFIHLFRCLFFWFQPPCCFSCSRFLEPASPLRMAESKSEYSNCYQLPSRRGRLGPRRHWYPAPEIFFHTLLKSLTPFLPATRSEQQGRDAQEEQNKSCFPKHTEVPEGSWPEWHGMLGHGGGCLGMARDAWAHRSRCSFPPPTDEKCKADSAKDNCSHRCA